MRQIDPEQVLRALITAPQGLRAAEISRRLKRRISQPTLWRVLHKLRSEGRVVMEVAARAARYHAAVEGANGSDVRRTFERGRRAGASLADFLVKHGAVVDTPDVMGDTPLANAIDQHQAAVVSVLLKDGAARYPRKVIVCHSHGFARACTMTTNLTVRVDTTVKKLLDRLSKATGRSRSYLAQDALRRYVEDEAWQIAEIEQAVKEADAGDFASEAEVADALSKWRAGAR